jgi:type IV pilus assembly protein PilB
MSKLRFGEYLIKQGVVNRETVSALLDEQRVVREEIGTLAVRRGFLAEEELVGHLSRFMGIPVLDTEGVTADPTVTGKVPKKLALKLNIFPVGLARKGGELVCACDRPVNIAALQSVSRLVNRPVLLQLVSQGRLKKMQSEQYSRQFDTTIKIGNLLSQGDDVHAISELLEKLLLRAINLDASDMHIEPTKDDLVIRFRLDGIMMLAENLPMVLAEKLITRVKVLARLDIAEKRMPQDGAFFFKPQRLDVDIHGVNLRVSVLPVVHGEKAVMRILPAHDSAISLTEIGMLPESLADFEKVVSTPYGIVLVTGPTGSGKSTTLYSVLQMLKSEAINITTLEDPVEMKMKGINQTQINPGPKISFAGALRAILRQDPDVIMVGEIRDGETVRVALQAAITGHLVLSTLHTNDAPSAFTRLIDMGAEPFLVANSIRGVLAQRLVRRVCPACADWHPISQAEQRMLGLAEDDLFSVRRGSGCELCNGKGYLGRSGIFELLVVDERLEQMIAAAESSDRLRDYALKHQSFLTLRQDGIAKIRQGVTTPEEVMRVTMA